MNKTNLVFTLLAALTLTACGGGSTSDTAAPSKLASYVGNWKSDCDFDIVYSVNMRENTAVRDSVIYTYKKEHYRDESCAGAIIATETVNAEVTVIHTGTADASVVFTEGAPGVMTRIDLVTLSLPAYTVTVSGPHVTFSTLEGQPAWCVKFYPGELCRSYSPSGPAESDFTGGMHVSGNKMYMLGPNGATYIAQAFSRV